MKSKHKKAGKNMIFGKKCHKLNRGRLAEAICLYSPRIQLSDLIVLAKNGKTLHIMDYIRMGEHLVLAIEDLYFHNSYDQHYVMRLSTHLDKIKMAEYRLLLEWDEEKGLLREWKCDEAHIIHYMPNQFIDLMNNWSYKITKQAHDLIEQVQREKEAAEREKYDKEEAIIQTYR